MWQDPIFSGQAEMSTRQVQESLEQMHTLGIHYVDFTGGEPSLHNSLVAGVRHAASLGMATEVTTNAIRPIRHLDKMVDSLSVMNVSLDTLSAKRYHAIRGVNTVNRTKNYLVELRQHYPELSVRIICTISSENISDVDDFMGFAADLRVPVVTMRSGRGPDIRRWLGVRWLPFLLLRRPDRSPFVRVLSMRRPHACNRVLFRVRWV